MDPTEHALLRAFDEAGDDETPRLILADYYAERGEAFKEAALREPAAKVCYGDNYGYGSGHGDGHGNGYGNGDGDGYGYGHGDGRGYGYGEDGKDCKHFQRLQETPMPKVGSTVFVMVGSGLAFCGLAKERVGGYTMVFAKASMICSTGGTPWDELAKGKGREQAIFRPWHNTGDGLLTITSNLWISYVWEGDLP